MRPEHIVVWFCPNCGAEQEDDINNTVLPICGGCETSFNWYEIPGFDHCKACQHAYEKLPGVDYCQNCFEYEEELRELWYEFMRIPGKEDWIPQDFHLWKTGELRSTIWDWFDQQSPRGIHYVMYTKEERLRDGYDD